MGFEMVQFRAANGDDSIWTRGSNGADLVTMEGDAFSLAGPDYFRGGVGFESVRVVGGDGVDEANLTGTSVDENFFSAPGLVRLTHDNLFTQFVGLEVVLADLGAGSDSAIMLGRAASDSLVLAPNSAQLVGTGYDYQVVGAELTTSYGGDDNDSSTIQDGNGIEVLNLRPRQDFIRARKHLFANRCNGRSFRQYMLRRRFYINTLLFPESRQSLSRLIGLQKDAFHVW